MVRVLVYNACCISKLWIFLFYGHPWVPLCPDKGGLTVLAIKLSVLAIGHYLPSSLSALYCNNTMDFTSIPKSKCRKINIRWRTIYYL